MFDEVKLVGSFQELLDLGDQPSGIDTRIDTDFGPGRDSVGHYENIGRSEYGILTSFPCLFRVRSVSPGSLELKPLVGLRDGVSAREAFSIQTHAINKTIIGIQYQ